MHTTSVSGALLKHESESVVRVSLTLVTDDLAPLRPIRHRMRRAYIDAYVKQVGESKPTEDHDDRNALYCLCIETMQNLVTKYAGGYEGWAKENGEDPAPGYND
ncbi:MAG: hypothetical protein Q9183_007650 [Haloplaca sp. 2 TL-2023]